MQHEVIYLQFHMQMCFFAILDETQHGFMDEDGGAVNYFYFDLALATSAATMIGAVGSLVVHAGNITAVAHVSRAS